jgi:hypothetical protein
MRLTDLVEEKNRAFNTDTDDDTQSEDIIEDLQTLLSSAQKYENVQAVQQVEYMTQRIAIDKKAHRSDLRRFGQAFGQFRSLLMRKVSH